MKSLLISLFTILSLIAQDKLLLDINELNSAVLSPEKFLGYKIGDYYTQHHNVMAYIKYLHESNPDRTQFIPYGLTNQRRELNLLIISSKENIANLEQIKENNLKLSKAQPVSDKVPPIIWLSYNVHGNETSSSEASMLTAYHLLAGTTAEVISTLENAVIIIDPMMNPDGRERYINWYKNSTSRKANEDVNSIEHQEPWPGGRSNHYMFDLNRDWAFASQKETQQRLLVYHQFKPHVFVDFHEMGYNSGYFFFPASKPINPILPASTAKWGKIFGDGNGEMLDQFGSLYYTAEFFDLFYPGYGDSYPSMYGSIGMTYEQSGHSRGGRIVQRNDGSILTLKERAHNHYKTSISTINTAIRNKNELIQDFKKFFVTAKSKGEKDKYSYFIIDQSGNYKELLKLLTFHDLKIEYVSQKSSVKINTGKNYTLNPGQAVISITSPEYVMLRNLFDDQISIPDTSFYDLSSWSLPKAFNVPVYKTSSKIQTQNEKPTNGIYNFEEAKIAYAFTPENVQSYRFMAELQKFNINMRVSSYQIKNGKYDLQPGTVFIYNKRNTHIPNLSNIIKSASQKYSIEIMSLQNGISESGVDLGSGSILPLKKVNLVILTGETFNSLNAGALWYFFDQKLEIDVTMMTINQFLRSNMDSYTTVIIPDDWGQGSRINREFGEHGVKKLTDWINAGGHVIGLEGGAGFLTTESSKISNVKIKESKKDDSYSETIVNLPYNKRTDFFNKRSFPGAFFNVQLDKSHPLTVGISNPFYVLKSDRMSFETNASFYNVGKFDTSSDVLGYASSEDKTQFNNTAYLLHKSMGSGNITLINSDPIYRAFTYGSAQLLLNCVFLGNARF